MDRAEIYQKAFYFTLGNLLHEIFVSYHESGVFLEKNRIINIVYDELPLFREVDYEIDVKPLRSEEEYERISGDIPLWFEPYDNMVVLITERWNKTGETNIIPFIVPNVCEEFIPVRD